MNKLLRWISNSKTDNHVRISEKGREIINNPKLSSEVVKAVIENKRNFITDEPIIVSVGKENISINRVSN